MNPGEKIPNKQTTSKILFPILPEFGSVVFFNRNMDKFSLRTLLKPLMDSLKSRGGFHFYSMKL